MSYPRRPQPAETSPTRDRIPPPYRSPDRGTSSFEDGPAYDHGRHRSSLSPSKRTSHRYSIRQIPSPSHDINDQDPILGQPRRHSSLTRKRSLVRPERNRIDRDHPNYHYIQHAQKMDIQPSDPGNDMVIEEVELEPRSSESAELDQSPSSEPRKRSHRQSAQIARSPSQRRMPKRLSKDMKNVEAEHVRKQKELDAARAPSLWLTYCHMVTFWCPDTVLRCFGKPQKAQQRAWREKVGLISIILLICTFVGYLTFGFTATVCPANGPTRLRVNQVGSGYLIIHGQAYDLSRSQHPYARGIPAGANVLYDLPQKHGGQDASFMFQNVNGHCKGLITPAPNSDVPTDSDGDLAWYFPCTTYNQDGSSAPNLTIPYYLGYACHLSSAARNSYYGLKVASDVYYTWADVKNTSRNLAVWGGDVLDLDLLQWFNTTQISYPARFDEIRSNSAVRGVDLTLAYTSSSDKQIAKCFSEIIKVGSIDTATVGCIASKVVLYVSLAFILGVVSAKFVMALAFQWFLSRRYAAPKTAKVANSKERAQEIESWTDDIYRPPPKHEEYGNGSLGRRTGNILPTTSRFTSPYAIDRTYNKGRPQPTTMASQHSTARLLPASSIFPSSEMSAPPYGRDSRTSVMMSEKTDARFSSFVTDVDGSTGVVHDGVVAQPPPEWQPFGYPLVHAICMVTAYSEGAEGLRTTLDSIATTEYPNSHKLLLVICDGLIKGRGEEFSTPDIVLGMMRDPVIPLADVKPFSYVAVASGSKRHNMAKIYCGFYDYGYDSTVPPNEQQKVPMLVVVKCGTPDEAVKAKPGNRGKRDSQIILMSFLQKVMFDERMTELEYEMFNGIWKITGISPDLYEVVLMVDADTKIFPDSMTHMVSAMVKDPEIMGLCGETKIANKRASWVSMIQVFEYVFTSPSLTVASDVSRYFISHHLAKSFESVFGGVTCLPGCFSMYRIKSPKGGQNYWVPILANPDIVEHYSENVVDTLHKKNLLLLGEDRYLTTLMLKTFPKRKQVFVPQAVCKTTVPDEFSVLLSQRRRWINSTIHNLMELVLVRDLCGTFCFSMQFVIFIELIGTLVLPAAISFTVYLSKPRIRPTCLYWQLLTSVQLYEQLLPESHTPQFPSFL